MALARKLGCEQNTSANSTIFAAGPVLRREGLESKRHRPKRVGAERQPSDGTGRAEEAAARIAGGPPRCGATIVTSLD